MDYVKCDNCGKEFNELDAYGIENVDKRFCSGICMEQWQLEKSASPQAPGQANSEPDKIDGGGK